MLNQHEIMQTIQMIDQQHLDVRTITMGISLLSCAHSDVKAACGKVYDKITRYAEKLVATGEAIEKEFGIPIVNKRISVTPIALVAAAAEADSYVPFAQALDRAAKTCGVNFIGGFSALVQKGMTDADRVLIRSIPEALATTDIVCASVNVGSTKAGIDMDAVALMGRTIKDLAEKTADKGGFGCAKLVVFCNAVEDNPFMAGAFHGVGEPEKVINVGVSGPGVVYHALQDVKGQPFDVVAETVKKTAFRITRMGQLVAQEASRRLDTPFGIVDLSLAPTPAIGDSVARILEEMGLEVCGTHGTTAALAMLNDAVKKGGVMASSSVGGLSGAFIPVSEDEGMIAAARAGTLCLDKLEAMMYKYLGKVKIRMDEERAASILEFVREQVSASVTMEDIKQYTEILEALAQNTGKPEFWEGADMPSMAALVAWSFENDIDLDEWIVDFCARNETYISDQTENLRYMREDLEHFISQAAVA